MINQIAKDLDHLKEYVEREVIFKEGSHKRNIYIINSGIIKLQKKINGNEMLLYILGKGRLFGESTLFDDESITLYSAIALENSMLIEFEREEFLEILKNDQNISFETLKQFDYNTKNNLLCLSDLIDKGEINNMVNTFLSYRILKEEGNQPSKEIVLTKDIMSGLTCCEGDELKRKIDTLLKMNVLSTSDDQYLLSQGNELEKTIAILNLKRRMVLDHGK
ncbi:cyclic nucleotide-binding domain-containing protein [bacterium]|nr:cyclic nucleotide-binding domain-containing protein [bacterium]